MSTQGEDVLAWLDNAISKRENAARAAENFGDAFAAGPEAPDCVYGTGSGGPYMRVAVPGFEGQTEAAVAHFALCGPESVLRRCAADRKLIYEVRRTAKNAKCRPWDPMYGPYADAMLAAAKVVAEGYGWTEGVR